MKIKQFIYAGELDDDRAIKDTDALLEAARRVPLRDWDEVIIEAEDGRYYRLEIPDAGLEHMTEAALRVHLRRLSREAGDPGIYSAVFGSSRVPDGGGLRHVLDGLLGDVLAEFSIEDVRAALNQIEGFPIPIKRPVSEGELTGEWGEIKNTTDLLNVAGRHLDGANASDILGPVYFEGVNGKFYQLTVEAVITEQPRSHVEEVFGVEAVGRELPWAAGAGGEEESDDEE